MSRPCARLFSTQLDDIPEATIATGDQSFNDNDFHDWVN